MTIDHALLAAIDSADLSNCQLRRGAIALAALLLDRVYIAELRELEELEIFLIRFPTYFEKESEGCETNLMAINEAVSILCNAFALDSPNKGLGIRHYVRECAKLDELPNKP
jgi:hypothetical protein